jgi:hypothetical protein
MGWEDPVDEEPIAEDSPAAGEVGAIHIIPPGGKRHFTVERTDADRTDPWFAILQTSAHGTDKFVDKYSQRKDDDDLLADFLTPYGVYAARIKILNDGGSTDSVAATIYSRDDGVAL